MYKLSTSIPYLLNRLGVRLGALFSRRIESYGLTLPMYRVLASLSEQPDQKLSELSAGTTIELSTISRLIGTMAARNLVSRVRLPEDERTVRINVTPHGAEIASELAREAQHYEDVAVSVLRAKEVNRLRADVVRIFEALDILEEELIAQAPRPDGAAAPSSKAKPKQAV